MESEKNFYAEPVGWDNPIKEVSHLLYLSDEIFPHDPRLTSYKDSLSILRAFYSSDRQQHSADVQRLRNFLRAPNEQIFIIEGPVGVGKSWFIRYNLEIEHLESAGENKERFHWGIIDLLRAAPDNAGEEIYKQICPIIEHYLTKNFFSPYNALKQFASEKYRLRLGLEKIQEHAPRIAAGATKLVERWTSLEEGKEYARILLDSLEFLDGPMLFIIIDNVDRISDSDQERLIAIVQRVLRNARIRLIVTIRDTTPLLSDRFRGLNEVRHRQMTLSQLNIQSMLEPRFKVSRAGEDIATYRIVDANHGKTYTFSQICDAIFDSQTGFMLKVLSGGNCRVALHMARRLIESNQLKALRNITNPQYAIAALMLSDDSLPDPSACILNLFDNKEKGERGNALIRYRVLELFLNENKLDLNSQRTKEYFARLGYTQERVKSVVERFMMASVVYSLGGHTPESLLKAGLDNIGFIVLTETGESYYTFLLNQLWYYIICKKDVARNMPSTRQSYDVNGNYYYITDTNFIEYLRDEERLENDRAQAWDKGHGPKFRGLNLAKPSIKARNELLRGKEDGKVN